MKKLLLAVLLIVTTPVLAQWPQVPAQNQAVEQCRPVIENLPMGAYRIGLLVAELQASTITGWGTNLFTQKLRDLKAITQGHCWDITQQIDLLIQKSTYTSAQQMNGDITYLREHTLAGVIGDNCKCACDNGQRKRWYSVWKNPYGPGNKCLTPAEAQALKDSGHGVRDLGTSCE